jgi:hydroxypyruvate reductase
MTVAISEILHNRITSGVAITKEGYLQPDSNRIPSQVKIFEANHPIPDQRNLDAGKNITTLAQEITHKDLVICLISGGGSSLLMHPYPGISLQDIQAVTNILLRCGASIDEINTIRKHVDMFKGGGLLKFFSQATVITLILSDVMGDDLGVIASGPTVADPTTFTDVWAILKKYQIMDQIPKKILSIIMAGIQGNFQETIKAEDPLFDRVAYIIIGNNSEAITNSVNVARIHGFETILLPYSLQGEASKMGEVLSLEAKSIQYASPTRTKPVCLITGGETVVRVRGTGKGGRNQELALGAVKGLADTTNSLLISLATDGGDGPTDAAGAVSSHETFSRGLAIGLDPDEYLNRNDSYHYFEALEDLLITGPTTTNVNDLVFLFIL